MITRALDVVIQLDRLPDGTRRLMGVTEVVGIEGSAIATQDLFTFEQRTVDEEGRVRGTYRSTGVRPKFAQRLSQHGIQLSPELFSFEMDV